MAWSPIFLAVGAGLRPLKPDAVPAIPWVWILGLPILLVAGVLLAIRMRRPKAGLEPKTATVGPASLSNRLEQVRKAGWIAAGDQLRACEVVAEVMRDLARMRFDVASLPLTTTEILRDLAARGAPESLCRPLGDVLTACDLIKFAGARLGTAELQGHLETARILVEAYGVPPAPLEAAPSAAFPADGKGRA